MNHDTVRTDKFRAEPLTDWGNDIWRFARHYGSPGDDCERKRWPTTRITPRPPWHPGGHRHPCTPLEGSGADGASARRVITEQWTGNVRRRTVPTYWAVLLGPVYFFAAGMWRKGTTVLATTLVIGLAGLWLLGPPAAMALSGWVGPVTAYLANRAYVLHVAAASRSWNPFEGLSLRRGAPDRRRTPTPHPDPDASRPSIGDDIPAGSQRLCERS